MTQQVPTEGFVDPRAQQGTPTGTPPQGTAPQPAPTNTVQPGGMEAAIAALTAALQQQKPAEPAAAEPVVQDSLNNFDISTIDDPIIQSMATVMQTVGKGIDFDRALGKALEDGRADLIDVAYLREAGGASAEQLITIAKGIVQAVQAKSQSVAQGIFNLAGGEQQWTSSVAVFNQGAPQELRLVVQQMLDSGKENLITAGAKLVVEYGKNSGKLPNMQPLVQSGAAALPASAALDKFTFQEELRKLDPNARDFEAKQNELFARRQLGKKLGK